MSGFITFKAIRRLNACRRPILSTGILAIIMALLGSCESTYISSVKATAPTSAEIAALSSEIKQLVKGLEYSDKVAEDFVKMVSGWKDEQGRAILVVWKNKLAEKKGEYRQGKISKAQLAKVEENIAKEFSQKIRKEITPNEKLFDLADVIKHKQAQCLGYSQLVYILGNSVGFSVKAIGVAELRTGKLSISHIACIVSLSDGMTMMVDLAFRFTVSKPFKLEEKFAKIGNYWELKNKNNPLGIHRRIQILDRSGLVTAIYYNQGTIYVNLGKHTQAISDLTKAIELNPKFADAYNNRGNAYFGLGKHTQAISDLTKAIELNPKLAQAYYSRGTAYADLGQHTQAISDYTKAIELNPKYAKAYYNRGNAYFGVGQHTQAISDYTKAIELNPKLAEAYNNRGVAYAFLRKFEEARKDLLKALELNPALKPLAKKVSEQFKLNLKFD